jgi:cell division protein DivIC
MYKRKFRSGLIIVLVFLIYFAVTFLNQEEILDQKNKELLGLQNSLEREKEIKKALEEEKSIAGSDEYIEKLAREKLGLVKEGETVFIDSNN